MFFFSLLAENWVELNKNAGFLTILQSIHTEILTWTNCYTCTMFSSHTLTPTHYTKATKKNERKRNGFVQQLWFYISNVVETCSMLMFSDVFKRKYLCWSNSVSFVHFLLALVFFCLFVCSFGFMCSGFLILDWSSGYWTEWHPLHSCCVLHHPKNQSHWWNHSDGQPQSRRTQRRFWD